VARLALLCANSPVRHKRKRTKTEDLGKAVHLKSTHYFLYPDADSTPHSRRLQHIQRTRNGYKLPKILLGARWTRWFDELAKQSLYVCSTYIGAQHSSLAHHTLSSPYRTE
jgi:hypothetical protein